jgi:hypothetical protein
MEAANLIVMHTESQPGEDWFAFKMHLDTETLRNLDAEQVAAVYESAARLTARLAEVNG